MSRELDSTEIAIQQKAQQLLEAFQALADLSNELNIANLLIELEILSLQLQDDSQFINPTHGIVKLHDISISYLELINLQLKEMIPTKQVAN